MLFSEGHTILVASLVIVLPMMLIEGLKTDLTQRELKEKYGQEGTSFNDGQSCYRDCDGKRMTCYYEFVVQMFDTMSELCGACENGTISDCFRSGCITANGRGRTMMTVNQQLPGPPINVCKNDRIIVDVMNHMPGTELSFHWHGLHQKETPWMDGVPMVTQCPILAGNSFRYIFNAREAGTHYYHAHSGLHRSNGLFGPINIRDPNDPNADYYDYDLDEHSIMLADWNNVMAEEKAPGAINSFRDAVQTDSLLVNGFGSFFDPQLQTFPYAPMAVFYVEKGKRHRFRISNSASFNCPFEFSVKNHNLTVIATDGFPIEPVVVEAVVSSAGERFDVVLDAKNDLDSNETLVTVRGLTVCNIGLQEFARIIFVDDINNFVKTPENHEPLKDRPSYNTTTSKITLNNPNIDCTTPNSNCIASLKQKQIADPLGGNLRNVEAKQIRLVLGSVKIAGQKRPSSYKTIGRTPTIDIINKISNVLPPIPGLIQDDSNIPYCSESNLPENCENQTACYCHHLIQLELCRVYELLIIDGRVGFNGPSHPIHMHGLGFQVIDMGFKPQLENGNSAFVNATDLPVVKDTVIIPTKGFTKIRFRACNPGYWFLHCHLEYHMHTGMSVIMKIGNDSDILTPPVKFPTCGHFLMPVSESD